MKFNYDYVKKPMLERTREYCEANYLSDHALSIIEINNGILLPGKMAQGGGIVDENKHYDHSYMHNSHPWSKPYPFDESELVYDDSEVLYLGMFHDVWGHAITDCLSQLWPVFSENVPKHILNAKWIYTTQRAKPLPDNFFKLLRLYGIDPDQLEYISKPTKFRKIYLPEKSFFIDNGKPNRMYTREYCDTIDRITSKVDADTRHPKLYFTRTAFPNANMRDFGETAIEKVFQDMGYYIVSPEKFSLEEQIAMLKGCKSFATTEGSCSHNAVFMNPGSELIIIRKINYFNGYQYPVNSVRDLNVTYIDANLSHLPNSRRKLWAGPFFMYVNKQLAAFAGIRPHFPVKTYCQYALPQLKKMVDRRLNRLPFFKKKQSDL